MLEIGVSETNPVALMAIVLVQQGDAPVTVMCLLVRCYLHRYHSSLIANPTWWSPRGPKYHALCLVCEGLLLSSITSLHV